MLAWIFLIRSLCLRAKLAPILGCCFRARRSLQGFHLEESKLLKELSKFDHILLSQPSSWISLDTVVKLSWALWLVSANLSTSQSHSCSSYTSLVLLQFLCGRCPLYHPSHPLSAVKWSYLCDNGKTRNLRTISIVDCLQESFQNLLELHIFFSASSYWLQGVMLNALFQQARAQQKF